jgi:hypothetical protein
MLFAACPCAECQCDQAHAALTSVAQALVTGITCTALALVFGTLVGYFLKGLSNFFRRN